MWREQVLSWLPESLVGLQNGAFECVLVRVRWWWWHAITFLPLISQKGPASALPLRLGLAAGAEIPVLGAAPGALLGGAVGIGLLAHNRNGPRPTSALERGLLISVTLSTCNLRS